ncbi:MAG: acyl-CoA dehydratase activase [Candidatus Sumerlaeia bacterium]|nr:acyl-CoA dehydratase activase [Candidatus Sumerlaeia bacterium]
MNDRRDLLLGLDAGSISVKAVVCDTSGQILAHYYRRHNGLPFEAALELLREVFTGFASERFRAVGATGSGGEALAALLGGHFVNEVVAQSAGAAVRTPQARTVIEMGGQDSKLLLFDHDERSGKPILRDFSMNTLCAAGTGSFLDQQASRLGVSIEEEFGRLTLECPSPPHMAGRCSVFAKSDMIHLQQIATPVGHIVAGLCFALARNFCSTIGQGKPFQRPIAFQGGVASNAGMRRAFEAALDLAPGELIVDPLHAVMGALGVAQILLAEQVETPVCRLDALERHIQTPVSEPAGLEPLIPPAAGRQSAGAEKSDPSVLSINTADPQSSPAPADPNGPLEVFLGIDIGSVSTNVVLIDRAGRLIAKRYLATAGQPIEAVRRGLDDIRREVGDRVIVRGCGTTGSGRYLIGDLVGADIIRNEITAQATAALAIDPTVDTIFEIGGQDSKYIRIRDGAVCDFEMNKACAAGTGSFLEEQAERLGLKIQDEFAEYAFASKSPVSLGDRCTVFMETDLQHHQQTGARKEDLVAGLAYSIVHNYLNRVVGGRPVGQRVFFQGGTAFNRAVVAAFNRVLGRDVVVPPHHEVTGAIGVALLARDTVGQGAPYRTTRFKGFDWSQRGWRVETFTCHKCANSCEIRRVQVADDPPLFYGSRCERFEVNRSAARETALPDLFAERAAALQACLKSNDFPPATRGRVGIPMALIFHEFLPLWATFFRSLGFDVIVSGETTKAIIHEGIEQVATEICYPIKVIHGHVAELLRRDVDFVFLPSIINSKSPDFGVRDRWNFNCPLVQSIPYTILAARDIGRHAGRIFSPALYMQMTQEHVADSLAEHRDRLRSTRREIRRALERGLEAQERFRRRMLERGREVLESLRPDERALVIVSRPYNGCDRGINLDVPRKLRQMGVQAIPLDMLPLDEMPLPDEWRRIYWCYGQKIIKAAEWIRGNPRLHAVYMTNFSCGPDSFLLSFFNYIMGDKPHLQIEIDEHSADAGVVTRCEAFLDTLANQRGEFSGNGSRWPIITGNSATIARSMSRIWRPTPTPSRPRCDRSACAPK